MYRDFFNNIVHLLVNQQMCNISLKSFLWTPKCINIVFNLRITAIVWKYLSEAKVSLKKKQIHFVHLPKVNYKQRISCNNVLIIYFTYKKTVDTGFLRQRIVED